MGSNTSKPTTTAVFHGETPVRFSNTLVSTLQSTSETDSTREKSLELHIQSRVASELARLEARESEILANVDQKLAEEDRKKGGEDGKTDERRKVQNEIMGLKRRLEALPRVRELEGEMKAAREEVLGCLKNNETRPLDCYKEVAAFREQTRKLEKAFVVATVGRDY